jgi:elongation factor Ts
MPDLSQIKELREATGCGISDCNKALTENHGDFEKAVDWLRKKGLSSASKKSSRTTSEGLVAVHINNNQATIIEVNSETDFVAKSDSFLELSNFTFDQIFSNKAFSLETLNIWHESHYFLFQLNKLLPLL